MEANILVADDSITIQKAIKIAFASHKVKIHCVSGYEAVLSFLKQWNGAPLDLVIADADLKGCEGIASFVNLREVTGSRILLLRGAYEPQIPEATFKDNGFTSILKKPFQGDSLVKVATGLMTNAPEVSASVVGATIEQSISANPSFEATLSDKVELGTDISEMVRAEVRAYCKEHFDKIAKEVILEEMRRLTEERSRYTI